MALTYPLAVNDFYELFGVASAEMTWMALRSIGRQGGGFLRMADLAPGYWQVDMESVPMLHANAEKVRARLTALNGAMNAFRLYPPTQPYPQNDPDGSTYGASTPIVTNRDNAYQADMSGFPAGYQVVAGDWVQITYDTSREYLGQFAQNKTADGSGIILNAPLTAPLPDSVANGDAVNLIKPAGLFKLSPGSVKLSTINATMQTLRLTAEQVHEAA